MDIDTDRSGDQADRTLSGYVKGVFMFNRYAILEVESIPREQALLRAMILDARRNAWRQNIQRFIALNCVVWAMIVLFIVAPMRSSVAQSASKQHTADVVLYLPLVANSTSTGHVP